MNVANDSGFKVAWCIGRVPPAPLTATLIVKGTFRIAHASPATPLPEEEQEHVTGDIPGGEGKDSGLVYPTDFALFKPNAEVLLNACCHPPGGKASSCMAQLTVGRWSKAVAVIGNRHWRRGLLLSKMSEPEPFEKMPIIYERAFGGTGFAANPCGIGLDEREIAPGLVARSLPNIEDPARLIGSPSDRPPPAGFCPLPMSAPQRMAKAGTYDKNWLKSNWPWFPDDFDWSYLNSAPADQVFQGFLRGDEDLAFTNMHPEHPVLASALPSVRVRWFVSEKDGAGRRFAEVSMRLDTLHADLNRCVLTLVWRGVLPVADKKQTNVLEHFIVRESMASPPRPLDDYRREVESRPAAKPFEPPPPPPELVPKMAPPEIDDSWTKPLEAEPPVEAQTAAFLDEVAGIQKGWRDDLTARGFGVENLPMPLGVVPNQQTPYEMALAAYNDLKAADPDLAARFPVPVPGDFEIEVPDPFAEVGGPPPEPAPARPEWTREAAAARALEGGSFENEDLEGLNLSGLDLSGLNFDATRMTGCDLTGSRLRGASLRGAAIAGARLDGADMRQAILEQADLTKCSLKGADFTEARLAEADFSKCSGDECRFASVEGRDPLFVEAVLPAADFSGARIPGADFDRATIPGANFAKADLTDASMEKAVVTAGNFEDAKLARLRAALSDAAGARLNRARADGSIWEEANLLGARFGAAFLTRANFSGARLGGADFTRAVVRQARLSDATCTKAVFFRADLFRATFEAADLSGADLRGANCYEVEFFEARTAGLQTLDANLKGSKLA